MGICSLRRARMDWCRCGIVRLAKNWLPCKDTPGLCGVQPGRPTACSSLPEAMMKRSACGELHNNLSSKHRRPQKIGNQDYSNWNASYSLNLPHFFLSHWFGGAKSPELESPAIIAL